MGFDAQFLKRIKTRIALTFSLLFLAVAIPAIIYAFHQVNIFFEGVYLQQMKAAGQTVAGLIEHGLIAEFDSLTAEISRITGSNVVLFSERGQIISRRYEGSIHDTAAALTYPILDHIEGSSENDDGIRHRFIKVGPRRYLQVQNELPGGMKLLQVKSLRRVTVLVQRMREVIFWSSFLGLITLIAVAFWVSAKITRPIEELTAFAQRIRAGDLPQKTKIKSPDEVGVLGDAMNDIVDDLQGARERMARLENLRRDFFANVREELEYPLMNIQTGFERLKFDDGTNADLRRAVDLALVQSQKLRRIIHTLIEISELEFGEISLEMKTVSAKKLIEAVAEGSRMAIESKGLVLEVDIPHLLETTMVTGDEKLLKIVFHNLLSNAIDFTEKGFVRILSDDDGERIKITVEDSGVGIPRSDMERIFERFYRVKSERPDGEKRTGLGLAVAKHIMNAHGQRLEAESILGVGSKFSIWLDKASDRA